MDLALGNRARRDGAQAPLAEPVDDRLAQDRTGAVARTQDEIGGGLAHAVPTVAHWLRVTISTSDAQISGRPPQQSCIRYSSKEVMFSYLAEMIFERPSRRLSISPAWP